MMATGIAAVLILLVAASLTGGIMAMAHGGEYAHHKSGEWMLARVVLQGAAVALLVLVAALG